MTIIRATARQDKTRFDHVSTLVYYFDYTISGLHLLVIKSEPCKKRRSADTDGACTLDKSRAMREKLVYEFQSASSNILLYFYLMKPFCLHDKT